jgi:SAM-dependent methyltransferase
MSFDRLAPHYRWMEFVLAGEKLQHCRLSLLNEVRDCRDVLVVGEGPGRFLQVCACKLPQTRIVCVDASRAMLDRARAAWQKSGGRPAQAKFIQATLPEWTPLAPAFDLIVTHFFLDCFPEPLLSQIVAKLAAAAKPGARWLLADFQIPASGFGHFRALALLALAYKFFRITTRLPARGLTSPDSALCAQGFRPRARRVFDLGLLRSDLWSRP